MVKTHKASRFELRTLEGIASAQDVILQTEQTNSTFTESGQRVYLCEVVSLHDYGQGSTADKLAEEAGKVNADNRAFRRRIRRLERKLQRERRRRGYEQRFVEF